VHHYADDPDLAGRHFHAVGINDSNIGAVGGRADGAGCFSHSSALHHTIGPVSEPPWHSLMVGPSQSIICSLTCLG
jgi:hypothetical protein